MSQSQGYKPAWRRKYKRWLRKLRRDTAARTRVRFNKWMDRSAWWHVYNNIGPVCGSNADKSLNQEQQP